MAQTSSFQIAPEKYTLLVVDDNITNLNVLTHSLNNIGFHTLIARNGLNAIERARIAQPDLILLDILMPGIDGFETCELLKQDEETADIPIIFMTALDEVEHKMRGFSLGAVDYVTKPFQHEEIYARVVTHLNNQKLTFHLEEVVAERTAQLQEAKEQAEKANQTKATFLAQISHELRTPLTTTRLYTALAMKHLKDFERTKQYLTIIEQSNAHLQALIEQILAFNQSAIVLNPRKTALHPIINKLEATYNPIATKKGVKFSATISDTLTAPFIIVLDDDYLYQILGSLLGNAFKFTDQGEVRLIISWPEKHLLRFEVIDSGRGIGLADIERIFLPFEQNGTSDHLAKGLGLGLPTSQRIVNAMGGQIYVESLPMHGSRFWFELPITRPIAMDH